MQVTKEGEQEYLVVLNLVELERVGVLAGSDCEGIEAVIESILVSSITIKYNQLMRQRHDQEPNRSHG